MTTCTWVGCTQQALFPQRDRQGFIWADLCTDHDGELADACNRGPVPRVLGAWVKAKGGAKKAAEAM